ncbi:MAG: MerR family transcriptional regulator [Propionibacteriaceae bacterium]|jgi:DNA-binding transcriptional MerR regulator|nr:MerR family transcriptional regulator [Propionibacteriaceae bacterium]
MSDQSGDYLVGIGDFSRFTMLSVRMLRHYDERGLLTPAHVDPYNGYRYYSSAQFRVAGRIRALRDAGCGIGQIAALLPAYDDEVAWRSALDRHATSLAAAAQQIDRQRSLLATIRNHIKEPFMSITVEERTVPALTVLSLRRTIPTYAAETELWYEFDRLAKSGTTPPYGARAGATYFDDDYRETGVDVAVWVELTKEFVPPTGLAVEQIPARRVAWATMYGAYEQTAAVCEAVGTWIAEKGYTLAGPMFNICVVSPAQDPNPDNWVTEVNFPIAG